MLLPEAFPFAGFLAQLFPAPGSRILDKTLVQETNEFALASPFA